MDDSNDCCFVNMAFPNAFVLLVIGIITLIIVRIFYVIYQSSKPLYTRSPGPLSTLVILGSGGHTAEMLNLLAMLQKDRFKPKYYVAAATDNMSLQKARVLEDSLVDKAGVDAVGTASFMQIYRSREVGQSYMTSIGTTLIAIAHALWLMVKMRPQVVFKIRWSSIFYVESIARVRRLSLSGLILYKLHMVDQLFVQWPQLKTKYPRANYVGCLM